jgi:uncharacterized protein (TIGR00725 family)
MPAPSLVAVIGKGRECPPEVADLARAVGVSLATLHPRVALVCGGLGGVMDAAAEGMTKGGGLAVGLLPEPHMGVSRHLSIRIRTGLPLRFRDMATAEAADVVVVCPGSHGTMLEAWAAADRGVQLLGVGDHDGWPTAHLAFTRARLAPAEIPAIVAGLLAMPRPQG